MQGSFGCQISRFGFANGAEVAEMDFAPVGLYSGLIAHAAKPSNQRNPKDADTVTAQGGMQVLSIGLLRNVSKVGDCVVCAVSINVVNMLFWEYTVLVQPCQPVLVLLGVCDTNDAVSILGQASGLSGALATG